MAEKYYEIETIRDVILNNPRVHWNYGDIDPESLMDALEFYTTSADVRPVKQGKWITRPQKTWIGVDVNGKETQPRQFFTYECPFCEFTIGAIGKDFNFCPNCGASMRKDDEL